MKLEMGTGWFPLTSGIMPLKTAWAWELRGRRPRYFWPRCSSWVLMGTASWKRARRVSGGGGARQGRADSNGAKGPAGSTYQLL